MTSRWQSLQQPAAGMQPLYSGCWSTSQLHKGTHRGTLLIFMWWRQRSEGTVPWYQHCCGRSESSRQQALWAAVKRGQLAVVQVILQHAGHLPVPQLLGLAGPHTIASDAVAALMAAAKGAHSATMAALCRACNQIYQSTRRTIGHWIASF